MNRGVPHATPAAPKAIRSVLLKGWQWTHSTGGGVELGVDCSSEHIVTGSPGQLQALQFYKLCFVGVHQLQETHKVRPSPL